MRLSDRINLLFATGLGLGYLPGPTGTYGSLLGLLLFWLVLPAASDWILVAVAVVLFVLAVAASSRAAEQFHHSDPKQVVCDEICGQWVSLLYVPVSGRTLLMAFLLFRFFDILKPFPARRFERFPGGWGITADDVMAGIYANAALQILLYWKF